MIPFRRRLYKRFLLLAACFIFSLSALDTIPATFAGTGHNKNARYDYSASTLDNAEKQYFDSFFILIDRATTLRVDLLQKMSNGTTYNFDEYYGMYQIVVSDMYSLRPPQDMYQVQDLIVDALRDQWTFFEQWHAAPSYEKTIYMNYGSHPYVRSSSRKLISAYNQMMRSYRHETSYNKQAFYAHLCALDFI